MFQFLAPWYEGNFFSGFMHGRGTLHWADGARLTCDWQANVPEGWGEYCTANGWRLEGRWEKGRFAEGTISHPDGRAVRGKVGDGWMPVV